MPAAQLPVLLTKDRIQAPQVHGDGHASASKTRLYEGRRIAVEFLAAGGTWAVWEWAEATGRKVYVFPVLLLAWIAYFAARAARRPDLWQAWGLRVANWRRAGLWYAAATVLALGVVLAWGLTNGRFVLPRHTWILILLYPAWALCQQFVLQNGIIANVKALGIPQRFLPLIGMAAFAAVHLPNLPLVGLTAMGGLLWTWVWQRAPNLWLLSLSHSVVGTAGFVLVLDRDPLRNFPEVAQLAAWL